MLEQLQRLQAHIGVLKTRLHHLESENESLTQKKQQDEEQHHAAQDGEREDLFKRHEGPWAAPPDL